eukprot:3135398-Rhodomonas_salina.2
MCSELCRRDSIVKDGPIQTKSKGFDCQVSLNTSTYHQNVISADSQEVLVDAAKAKHHCHSKRSKSTHKTVLFLLLARSQFDKLIKVKLVVPVRVDVLEQHLTQPNPSSF